MKIAIISGASSGIGKELAKCLDEKYIDQIWLIARNEERLISLSKELKKETKILPYDLSDASSFDKIKTELKNNKCEIKYLVCSAGVGYNGSVESITEDNIKRMIDINCSALALLIKISIPYFCSDGRIINIASGAGFLPQPNFSVYAATKSFVISLSRALGHELKSKKIYVTAVCPGPVDTEFFASLENVKEYKKNFLLNPIKLAKGIIKASDRKKRVYSPSFSIKLVHMASKILPTNLILYFYK